MIFNHKGYLNYEVPNSWCVEEDEDNLNVFNPYGNGAMTISFYNVLSSSETLDEQVSIMAKKFIDKNKIVLDRPFVLYCSKNGKTTLYGTGITEDNWFIKLWVVAKSPKIVFASYQSKKKSKEVVVCDNIIESMNFCL